MKVLIASLFHPEIVRGGAQQVAYELFCGLRDMDGCEPTLLAAVDQTYSAFYKSGACITGFDGRSGEFLFLSRGYDYWWHKTSDPRLLDAYVDFLEELRPDVVHFHHFLLFGVDLLTMTRRVLPHARIVFTLHEFLAICDANGQMLRVKDNALCDRASPTRCHQCFPQRGPEAFFLRELWMKRHFAAVDVFTTPSRFMIEHYVRWGLARERIRHVTNGQPDYSEGRPQAPRDGARNRFGFFGQLVDNKGVWLILQAVEHLRSDGFKDFFVEINGDNLRYASEPRRQEIEAFRQAEEARPVADRRVVFNGSYEVRQLPARMARVDWCIVPSVWWETFALVISEAWMFRRPVLASDIGAMRERLADEKGGLLFPAGDARALAATMRRAVTQSDLWSALTKEIPTPPSRSEMTLNMLSCYDANRTITSAPAARMPPGRRSGVGHVAA